MNDTLDKLHVSVNYYNRFTNLNKLKIGRDYFTMWTVFIIEEGAIVYDIDGNGRHTLNKGELLLCPPYTTLDKHNTSRISFDLIRFYQEEAAYYTMPGKLQIKINRRIADSLELLHGRFVKNSADINPYCNILLMDIWYQICILASGSNIERRFEAYSGDFRNVLDYIDNNLDKDLSLSALSDMCGCTVQTLINRFKAFSGYTPGEYITRLRIDMAKKLIAGSVHPLRAVALRCGYSSEYYFSYLFKKITGITPSQYKREHAFEAYRLYGGGRGPEANEKKL